MEPQYRLDLSSTPLARYTHQGMRPWRALGMVRRDDFEGPDYQFVSASFSGDTPVLDGRVHEAQLQPGLWMHCAEVVDLHSMASRVRVEGGLRLVIVLAGELDVTIGGHHLRLSAQDSSLSNAALVAMPQSAMFERRWKRGKWERKLSLHFTPEWLKAHGCLSRDDDAIPPCPFGNWLPVPTHGEELCMLKWRPSPHAISLAEQLVLDAENSESELQRLRQAGRALELLYEALADRGKSTSTAQCKTVLRPREHERMLRLRNFLDAEILRPYETQLTIEELGREFGLSVSALQRQFRQAFSSSINEYRRSMRLNRARADIERGSSIADAACRAGYTSAANFSTAFRRQFGISPRELQGRG